MGFLYVLVIIIGVSVFAACAIAGAQYLAQRLWGASPDSDAFDFENNTPGQQKEFAVRCYLAAIAAAAGALLIGYLLAFFQHFMAHFNQLALLVTLLFAGGAYASTMFVFKQEPRRTVLMAGAATLIYILMELLFGISKTFLAMR